MVEIIGNHIHIVESPKNINLQASPKVNSTIITRTTRTTSSLIKPGYIYNNFEDFCVNEIKINPYPEQALIGSSLFGELCTKCNTPKKKYFLCSNCNKFSGQKEVLIGCGGMRGGKTVLNSLIGLYFLHQLLTIDDIQTYFNVYKGHKLNFIFASSFGICETEWEAFYDMWKNSPLLTSYNHKTSKNFIEYDNIRCYSKDSLSLSFPLVFACLNDYSWENPLIADDFKLELYKNMRTLRNTNNSIKPLSIYSGSAKDANDPLMSMLNTSKGKTNTQTYHYTTWEMNPNITRQDLNVQEQQDFQKFRRDYGSLKI